MSPNVNQASFGRGSVTVASAVRWRALAKQMLPTTFSDASDNDSWRISTYIFFFSLLPEVREAHRTGKTEFLANAYGFAEWSYDHPAKELWNAVAVSFYEHLFDDGADPMTVLPWLSKQVRTGVLGLWEFRLSGKDFARLRPMVEAVEHRHGDVCGRALIEALKQMGCN